MDHKQAVPSSDFLVCARLTRSLAHILRGDLSVINNDLAYLSSIVGPTELERSRARCSQAAAVLGKLRALSVEDSWSEVSGVELAALLGASLDDECARFRFRVDTSATEQAMTSLGEIWSCSEGRPSLQKCSAHSRLVVLRLVNRDARPLRGSYTSCSEFAAAERGERAVIDGCIADLVFRNQGWTVEISERGEIAIRIPTIMASA